MIRLISSSQVLDLLSTTDAFSNCSAVRISLTKAEQYSGAWVVLVWKPCFPFISSVTLYCALPSEGPNKYGTWHKEGSLFLTVLMQNTRLSKMNTLFDSALACPAFGALLVRFCFHAPCFPLCVDHCVEQVVLRLCGLFSHAQS